MVFSLLILFLSFVFIFSLFAALTIARACALYLSGYHVCLPSCAHTRLLDGRILNQTMFFPDRLIATEGLDFQGISCYPIFDFSKQTMNGFLYSCNAP